MTRSSLANGPINFEKAMMQACVTNELSLEEQKLLAEYVHDLTQFLPQPPEVEAQFNEMSLNDLFFPPGLEQDMNALDQEQEQQVAQDIEQDTWKQNVHLIDAFHIGHPRGVQGSPTGVRRTLRPRVGILHHLTPGVGVNEPRKGESGEALLY